MSAEKKPPKAKRTTTTTLKSVRSRTDWGSEAPSETCSNYISVLKDSPGSPSQNDPRTFSYQAIEQELESLKSSFSKNSSLKSSFSKKGKSSLHRGNRKAEHGSENRSPLQEGRIAGSQVPVPGRSAGSQVAPTGARNCRSPGGDGNSASPGASPSSKAGVAETAERAIKSSPRSSPMESVSLRSGKSHSRGSGAGGVDLMSEFEPVPSEGEVRETSGAGVPPVEVPSAMDTHTSIAEVPSESLGLPSPDRARPSHLAEQPPQADLPTYFPATDRPTFPSGLPKTVSYDHTSPAPIPQTVPHPTTPPTPLLAVPPYNYPQIFTGPSSSSAPGLAAVHPVSGRMGIGNLSVGIESPFVARVSNFANRSREASVLSGRGNVDEKDICYLSQ